MCENKETYVQYISNGIGIFENTLRMTERDSWKALEKAIEIQKNQDDIFIIGFRFFDRDGTSSKIENVSGIHYLKGEVFVYPKISNEILQYINGLGKRFEKGQKIIVILGDYPMVYPFNNEDVLEDYDKAIKKIEAKEKELLAKKLEKDIVDYKQKLCDSLRGIINAIDGSDYSAIRVKEITTKNERTISALDIMDNGGNFEVNIEYLKDKTKELLLLRQGLSSVEDDEW